MVRDYVDEEQEARERLEDCQRAIEETEESLELSLGLVNRHAEGTPIGDLAREIDNLLQKRLDALTTEWDYIDEELEFLADKAHEQRKSEMNWLNEEYIRATRRR